VHYERPIHQPVGWVHSLCTQGGGGVSGKSPRCVLYNSASPSSGPSRVVSTRSSTRDHDLARDIAQQLELRAATRRVGPRVMQQTDSDVLGAAPAIAARSLRAVKVGVSLLTLVPGEIGGAETYARGLARGLAEAGRLDYTAFVPPVASGAGEGLPEVLVSEYRRAHSVPERALAMAAAALRPGPLRRRYEGVEIVHYPLTIAVPTLRLPSVVTVHDLQHLDLPHLFGRSERLFRRRAHEGSARRAEAVIVPSQFVRRSVVEHLGLPPDRVHAIPHGIDHERFRPGPEQREPFLLYPGRPWPHKNHARLFEALTLLRRERPQLELVLTGGGHEGRAVPPGVRVEGQVTPEELVSLYRRAACLVFPSLYEGFGQPPLEAMACGCPVAASRAAAIPEAVGDAAALFDPADAEDMAAVVSAVLESPERFVRAGLERASGFTWAETARRHEQVYRSIR